MAKIIDGKAISKQIREEIAAETAAFEAEKAVHIPDARIASVAWRNLYRTDEMQSRIDFCDRALVHRSLLFLFCAREIPDCAGFTLLFYQKYLCFSIVHLYFVTFHSPFFRV